MTVCTPHEYAGPRPCPYCQRDALDRALAIASQQIQSLMKERDALRRECAVGCLQLIDRAFIGTADQALEELAAGKTDPAVIALVRQYHVHPLDTCSRCGKPAPCIGGDFNLEQEGPLVTPAVCAWGCEP